MVALEWGWEETLNGCDGQHVELSGEKGSLIDKGEQVYERSTPLRLENRHMLCAPTPKRRLGVHFYCGTLTGAKL